MEKMLPEKASLLTNLRWDKIMRLPAQLLWKSLTWFFRFPPTLSYAKIASYLACPLKYKFQYMDKIPSKPSVHLSFGTSLHNALELFHRKFGRGPATEDQLLSCLEKSWISEGYASPAEENGHREKAKNILTRYWSDNKDISSTPKYLEQPVEDKIGDYVIKGKFDRVDLNQDGKFDLIDYKTGKTLNGSQLKKELQPKIYSILAKRKWGKKFNRIFFYYLETGEKTFVDFSPEELRQTLQTIKEVGRSIYEKDFSPNPSVLCSWCDYQPICPSWKDRSSHKDLFRLSYSKMKSYELCPRNYRFSYVDKVPSQPRSFFSIGNSIHNALEEFYEYEGFLKEPSLKWLLELLKKHWISAGYDNPEHEKKFFEEAESMLKVYYRDWVKGKFRKAWACEPYFELPIGNGYVTTGYIDRIDRLADGTYEIIDYKTEPKIRTQQEVDEDLQLTVYYWACIKNFGFAPSRVSLHFMRHNKIVSTTRSQKDIDHLTGFVNNLGEQMRTDTEFAPKLNKYCRTCDHLAGCPLESEARQKAKDEGESYREIVESVRESLALQASEPDAEK